jgi:hypothetical protein
MGIFDKLFGNKEEKEYRSILLDVYNLLMQKIQALEEREVIDFFEVILDCSERCLRVILFSSPPEFEFKRAITKDKTEYWLSKVSLVLMSYSYHYYGYPPEIESNKALVEISEMSYKEYWQRMFYSYNKIFGEKIGQKEVDYYASGLKEDDEKEYSKSGNMEKAFELTVRDHITIGSELLERIWGIGLSSVSKQTLTSYKLGSGMENVDPQAKKALFVGMSIWRAYQQIVQPFLEKLIKEY